MAFPINPTDNQKYNNRIYNSSIDAWNDLPIIATPSPVAYVLGGVLSGGDYIQLAANGALNSKFNIQTFSISMWVKMPTLASYGILWSYDYTSHNAPYYAQQIRIESNGSLYLDFNNRGGLSTGANAIPANTWKHIVVTSTSGSTKLYIDKEVNQSNTNTGTISYWAQPVWIGRGNWAITQTIEVRHVGFYNKILSTSEINVLFDQFSKAAYIA